jgi:signal transduction histidine kinase
MQPVLDRRGINMAWHVQPASDADILDAVRAQHMVAIVQEALSNVLQHAQATQVTVRLSHSQDGEQGRWQLDICDNGRGVSQASMAARAPSSGFGLEGMHARARQIGAVLELMRRDGGAPASAWCSLTAAAPTPCTQSNAARRPCWMAGEGGGGPLLVGCW